MAIIQIIVATLVWFFARQSMVAVAIVVVVIADLWPNGEAPTWSALLRKTTQLVVSLSAVLIIAILPKVISQAAVGVAYAAWRIWGNKLHYSDRGGLIKLLVVQLVWLEAVYLLPAIWQTPRIVVLALIWLAGSATVLQALTERGERSAKLMAAAWGLVLVEVSWVFMFWLVSYITPGSYLIVPQPVLVLGALAYCFGSIYSAQRGGTLNKSRLTEYLLIGLILIWIVIAGTPWRGTI